MGYLMKPMIDETMLLDDKQRLRTMEELNQIGRTTEAAYLENSKVREEAQSETLNHDQKNRTDGGECGEGQGGSTKQSNTTTSLKRKARAGESSESEQSKQGELGTKRVQSRGFKVTRDSQQTLGRQDHEMETEQGGIGVSSPLGEQMETSRQEDGGLNPSKEQEMEEATDQEEVGTNNEREFSEGKSASSAMRPTREGEGGEGEQGEESEESSSEGGWEDVEDEEEEEPETLEIWVNCVQALEWERAVACEVPLAHHKHLRNLKEATGATKGITTTNRFEILKKEKEINEFYAEQYGWKAEHHNNDIQVRNEVYSKQFEWPKTYLPKAMKRSESKRKASYASTKDEGGDEELMEDARRQAAILEVQVNVLKDHNRELGEDTTNSEKIAYVPHKEIEAAARLYARNSPRCRVIIPFKWNEVHKEWEVAIHRSLELVTMDEANCSGQALKGRISEDLSAHAYVIGDWKQEKGDSTDTTGTSQAEDYRPIMFKLKETTKLSDGLIWMPWQVVETIPYGLLGGLVTAEWVATSAALVVKTDASLWKPEYIEKRISRGATRLDLSQTGS
ncbi:hypothetical protein CBR_g36629 [Chara braunii]|uniref:Uncharacterized protein n=1 Tax=Chara braunii TaxID=69332 RepID=A0A388LL08_CHABU|nr:hypothetical protein CBR_g36629 [Chara braunii]|eukprot:GBG83010.1 hypothetical protein CBR_g36629 [Chara braunii]